MLSKEMEGFLTYVHIRDGTIYRFSNIFQYIGHVDLDLDIEFRFSKISILILILKSSSPKSWFWYWYWKKWNIDIDIDIDIVKKQQNYRKMGKDCPIIIRTLILLSLFPVNFHAFNFEPGKVWGHFWIAELFKTALTLPQVQN